MKYAILIQTDGSSSEGNAGWVWVLVYIYTQDWIGAAEELKYAILIQTDGSSEGNAGWVWVLVYIYTQDWIGLDTDDRQRHTTDTRIKERTARKYALRLTVAGCSMHGEHLAT
jgi:hypothetical protein